MMRDFRCKRTEKRSWGADRTAAFTLVELLVVMAIMAIVMAVTLPAIRSLQEAYNLDAVSQAVVGQLNTARQAALGSSHPVQVRFYLMADYNGAASTSIFHPATTTVYRGIQCFQEGDPTTTSIPVTPITKPYFFPVPVIIASPDAISMSGADVSSMLNSSYSGITVVGASDPNNPLPPPYGSSYQYSYFRMRTNSRTDLSTASSANTTLTFVLETSASKASATSLPPNYVTIELNSVTGGIRYYRP
jgi:uncharacterized protein (TIGR02596 family)